jgi:DNA-binding transcriptional LysR family regulator
VSPRGDTTGAVDRPLAALGLGRRIRLLVATYLALPAVREATDLIATVPERTARRIAAAGFSVTALPLALAVTVSMAWHRRNARTPAHLWFRALLIEAARV